MGPFISLIVSSAVVFSSPIILIFHQAFPLCVLILVSLCSAENVYQFVRLMGRSASLLTLECALRCHPNMTFVGEEVQAKKQSLKALVAMTADLVEARAKLGKHYGVILLPEGLIEFIPEVGKRFSV